MDARRLKPCPFCGSKDDLVIDRFDEVFRAVECGACGARGSWRGSEDLDDEFGDDYAAAAERDAISSWNAAARKRSNR